jgi:hypothetical protein
VRVLPSHPAWFHPPLPQQHGGLETTATPERRACVLVMPFVSRACFETLDAFLRAVEQCTLAMTAYTERIAAATAAYEAEVCLRSTSEYDALADVADQFRYRGALVTFDPRTGTLLCSVRPQIIVTSMNAAPQPLVWCSMRLRRVGNAVTVSASPDMFLDESDPICVASVRPKVDKLTHNVQRKLFRDGLALPLDSPAATLRYVNAVTDDPEGKHVPRRHDDLVARIMCGGDFPIVSRVADSVSDHVRSKVCGDVAHWKRNAPIEVFDTILASYKHRFPSIVIDDACRSAGQPARRPPTFSPPPNVLTCAHLACKPVVVQDRDTRTACLRFIAATDPIALDTETRLLPESNCDIDVIQLGTAAHVYIVSPATESGAFMKALHAALTGKTVLHWGGNDVDKLASCMGAASLPIASSLDVQRDLFSGRGIGICANDYTGGYYQMSKTWTCSGWDVRPLTAGQIEYAALDVAVLYVLWLSKRAENPFSVWSASCKVDSIRPRYHSFRMPPRQPSSGADGDDYELHGIAYTPGAIGHYERGFRTRAFFVEESGSIAARGFEEPSYGEVTDAPAALRQDAARYFLTMLRDRCMCCSACRHIIREHAPADFFCNPTHRQPPDDIHRSKNAADIAWYCLQQLGHVLKQSIRVDRNTDWMPRIIASVHDDLMRGFVSTTLVWF